MNTLPTPAQEAFTVFLKFTRERLLAAVRKHRDKHSQAELWKHVDDSGKWVVRITGLPNEDYADDPDYADEKIGQTLSVTQVYANNAYSTLCRAIYPRTSLKIIECPGEYMEWL